MRSSPDPFRVVTNDLGNGRDGLGELKMIGITVSWLGAGLNSVRFENHKNEKAQVVGYDVRRQFARNVIRIYLKFID